MKSSKLDKSTDVADKHPFNQIQDEILLKVAAIVAEHGADFAYPTMTIDLPEELKK